MVVGRVVDFVAAEVVDMVRVVFVTAVIKVGSASALQPVAATAATTSAAVRIDVTVGSVSAAHVSRG